MKGWRRSGIAAMLLAVTLSDSAACSMPPGWTAARGFAEAALVFHGLVTQTTIAPLPGEQPLSDFYMIDARYELREAIKGKPQPNGVVSTTNAIMGGCGVPVIAGQEYILFVNRFDDPLPPEVAASGSQGLISIFDTQLIGGAPEAKEKALNEARALGK